MGVKLSLASDLFNIAKDFTVNLYQNLDVTLATIFITLFFFFYKDNIAKVLLTIFRMRWRFSGFIVFVIMYIFLLPIIVKIGVEFIISQEPLIKWIIIVVLVLWNFDNFKSRV